MFMEDGERADRKRAFGRCRKEESHLCLGSGAFIYDDCAPVIQESEQGQVLKGLAPLVTFALEPGILG